MPEKERINTEGAETGALRARRKLTRRVSRSGEAGADAVAEGFAVDGFAFEGGFGGFYYGAHLLDGFGFVELAELFGFLVGDGGFDHTEDAETELVFGAHGVGEVFLDFFGESHGNEYSRGRRKEFNTEFTEGTEKSKRE